MEKKNRPLQAANSDIRVSDVTPLTKSLQEPKRTPKKHRARVYMLRTGISEPCLSRSYRGAWLNSYQ
ncbi:hypothetical protein BM600_000333 [Escherichia coli]|nr:hypothetical protein [Escherichia coli]